MNCIFCGFANNPSASERISKNHNYFHNANLTTFDDINPAAKNHILVIPNNHIKDLWALDSSHIGLLREMRDAGLAVLLKNGAPLENIELGFVRNNF
jgi:diadenosine tetraphosphate (Ap4A) HIT family hydrolase